MSAMIKSSLPMFCGKIECDTNREKIEKYSIYFLLYIKADICLISGG